MTAKTESLTAINKIDYDKLSKKFTKVLNSFDDNFIEKWFESDSQHTKLEINKKDMYYIRKNQRVLIINRLSFGRLCRGEDELPEYYYIPDKFDVIVVRCRSLPKGYYNSPMGKARIMAVMNEGGIVTKSIKHGIKGYLVEEENINFME